MRLRPRSVRMRLTLWYAAALAGALLLYGVFVFAVLWRMMLHDLQRENERDITVTERMLEREAGEWVWEDVDDDPSTLPEIPAISVVGLDGRVIFESPDYMRFKRGRHLESGRAAQVEGVHVQINAVQLTSPMFRQLALLGVVLLLAVPIAVGLASAAGYLLARRALAPVEGMAARARRITADRLSERLPLENPDDELGHLAGIINETLARLEQSFEQLRRFTADASHELRTPLTALRTVGEVGLRDTRSSEQYRDTIASMLEEVDRLTRLIDSLLMLSRADSGQFRLHLERFSLGELVGEVAQHLRVLAEEKNLLLEVTSSAEVEIEADRTMLRQAIINLVDNAIKYSPEDAHVRLAVFGRDGSAQVEVQDEGPGIAAEHQPKVFDRFYRVDKARSRQVGGVGLGLSIARWAIEAHGGRIELESRIGGGSLFRIRLPRSKTPQHAEETYA